LISFLFMRKGDNPTGGKSHYAFRYFPLFMVSCDVIEYEFSNGAGRILAHARNGSLENFAAWRT